MTNQTLEHPHVGILLHGRHLQTYGWTEMMWGHSEKDLLGALPTLIRSILTESSQRIAFIVIGSGASKNERGLYEADVIKQTLLDGFNQLDNYPSIALHSEWKTEKDTIRSLIQNAMTDTTSQNTCEEIAKAATLFTQHHISKVIEITCASHAPRCQLLQSTARDQAIIPHSQQWHLIADDIAYPGTAVTDTLVLEEPHRYDDPLLKLPKNLHPTTLFRTPMTLVPDKKAEYLARIASIELDDSESD